MVAVSGASRLSQVDALRGLAAMAVVFFHYTTRYQQLYGTPDAMPLAMPYGHYGVNLFFIISGFVIFMTLERTQRSMDFLVSRFSRLFPAYWVCIAITFGAVAWLGLPGKEVNAWQALANGLMLHNLLLKVPHVDGVYWTLEVELLFYIAMLALYKLGGLTHVHVALTAGLVLKLVYAAAAHWAGIDLPWILYRVLFLEALPWFAIGITVYQITQGGQRWNGPRLVTVTLALACLAATRPWPEAVLACVFGTAVWAAARGQLAWLGHRVFVFLGTISYPLYLLHENIGWALQRTWLAMGWSFYATVAGAIGVSVLLAWAVHRAVELPAMRAIRERYQLKRQPTT
jgi:peptidoglycan/LPS O-acetylase OafA/YrhL